MKKQIKNILIKSRLLKSIVDQLLKLKRRKRISFFYDKLISNVKKGNLTVSLENIPGEFTIDIRSHILKRVLINKNYEPEIVKQVLAAIDPKKDAINIGANIGLFANLIASVINCDRKILAIEPTPNAFKLLKFNLEQNGNIEKTILFNGVATDHKSNVKINIIEGKEEYSSIGKIVMQFDKIEKYTSIIVKGETLDNLVDINNLNPGIVFMDVEGAEFSVLKGSINTLKKFKPIIISEIVDDFLKEQNSSAKQIIELLIETGYRISSLDQGKIDYPFKGNIIAIPTSI